jgi:predicted DNA binding CopG/RHH family protein
MKRPKTENRKMKMISVRLPEELARAAKIHAAQTEVNVQTIMAKALEEYLKAAARKSVRS